MNRIEIREEQTSDINDIRTITELAFRGKPYAGGDEQDVIDRLRERKALSLSLVATDAERVCGHVAFSPAILSNSSASWFALGPVSVTPTLQGQGIGAQLINTGLQHFQTLGALGCILTGNPDYYQRFGFELSPKNCPEGEPAEYFMVKIYEPSILQGKFAFHPAFYGNS